MAAPRGHRTLPHTADVIIEAWGATRAACLEEAVVALVEAFADTANADVADAVPLALEPDDDEHLLVALLDEVIYLLEVQGFVPTSVTVADRDDGGLGGSFEVARVADVEAIGAVPKAIARSDLAFGRDSRGRWSCRVTVDV